MNKSTLKAEFINAKIKDAKYIGVSIKTEGSSQPEIIINPAENFEEKLRSLGAEIERVSSEKEIQKFKLRVG